MFARTPYYVLTGGLVIIFLFPLVWAMVSSFSAQAGSAQALGYGLGNYERLFNFQEGLPRYFMNSVVIAALTVLLHGDRLDAGRLFVRPLQLPGQEHPVPDRAGDPDGAVRDTADPAVRPAAPAELDNTLVGLSLVLAVYQLPFATFMMRVSFEAVPTELEEAALVDGANSLDVLRRIMLPAVIPGLITVVLFAFLASWNDFFAPLILISDPSQSPLPLAIAVLRQQTMGVIDYGATEAGVVVMAVPCILIFVLLQRYYMRGFMSGAVKG